VNTFRAAHQRPHLSIGSSSMGPTSNFWPPPTELEKCAPIGHVSQPER